MIDFLQEIIEAFVADNGFWLLAGLTDVSFETGDNSRYRHSLKTMADAGCPQDLLARLKLGVNGNLAAICASRYSALGPIHANRARRNRERPDLCFGQCSDGTETVVEVKAVYEMTMPKFYGMRGTHSVADDGAKLLRIRKEGTAGHLYQLVFFLELPNYNYPAGESLMKAGWSRWDCRESYKYCCSIAEQFAEVRKYLPSPTYPRKSPKIHRLPQPSPEVAALVKRWFASTFRPEQSSWTFHATDQLNDVAVGYAIWEY